MWWLVSPLLALMNAVNAAGTPAAATTRMAASAASSDVNRTNRAATAPVLVLRTADGQSWRFSMDDLHRLPARQVRTALPASLGMASASDWEGVPLSHLVTLTGTAPRSLALTALNGYAVTVPAQDLTRFDPVLAYRRDGHEITVRDKGPLILIYPFDRHPALNRQVYINRTIWQVHEIVLE